MESTTEPIIIETEVAASPERVWQAWTHPAELSVWLSEVANVRPEVGGPYELFWEPAHPERNSTLGCRISALKPHEHLAFSWKGPVPYADLMNVEPPPTAVRVTFQSVAPYRTNVRLEHFGWGEGPRWREAREWHKKVWDIALSRLKNQFRQ